MGTVMVLLVDCRHYCSRSSSQPPVVVLVLSQESSLNPIVSTAYLRRELDVDTILTPQQVIL